MDDKQRKDLDSLLRLRRQELYDELEDFPYIKTLSIKYKITEQFESIDILLEQLNRSQM